MLKSIKKIVLFCVVLGFVFIGTGVFAEEVSTEDLRERIEDLKEKAEEIAQTIEERKAESDYNLYLTEYIKYGAENNPEEVKKLQIFLNEYEGEDIPVTGFYGEITLGAVKRLQKKYADEILHPWGITEPTGYVYKTTQRFINNKKCPDVDLPIPELVPDTTSSKTKEEAPEEKETETITEEPFLEEKEEDIEGEEFVLEDEEILEETEEENEKNKEDKDENRRVGAWLVVIFGSVVLGSTLYYIYTLKGEKKRVN